LTSASAWRFRRLIVAIVALMVLAVSVNLHPISFEPIDSMVAEVTHSHDADDETSTDLAHKGIHHDHHAELAFDMDINFLSPPMAHDRSLDQSESRQVSLTIDRPPDAAQC